ncbi:MAG: hypothetical protein HRU19_28175 [Pseudobacteriovorax sp.]|nr:hypothetical protein [Pseudobacteriovorax sp.]
MDAVKRYLEDVGGSVEILLGEPHRNDPGYYHVMFKIAIPLSHRIPDQEYKKAC